MTNNTAVEKIDLDDLRTWLWGSANILRGTVDSSDFKNYIFGLIFIKRLSDVFDEREGRIEQAIFLEQLELFAQRVRDKDAKPSELGLTTATERATYNYLEEQVNEAEALAWTKGIFSHPDIAEVMLSPIWKKQTDIHNEIKKKIRTILRGLGGWNITMARQHAGEIFNIMLNN